MAQDYTTLNNPRFLYFAELNHPFPAWVSASPLPTTDQFEKCASTAFADQSRRLLPIRDKVSTFHSALNVFAHLDEFSEDVFNRVKNACAFHDIEADVAPYAELFADSFEKSASDMLAPAGRFAIDQTINGTAYQLLPLNDAQDVRDSAHELAKMAAERRIHFLTMLPAAEAVVKAASEFGVSVLPKIVERFGCERCPDLEKAAAMIAGREELSKSADSSALRAEYEEAVNEALRGEISPHLCMQKIAAIDDSAGITYKLHEASPVLTPSEIVFSGPLVSEVEKAAADHVAIKDVLVPLAVVKSVDIMDAYYKLSKSAHQQLLTGLPDVTDAKELSLSIMGWSDADQRTLLRMVSEA